MVSTEALQQIPFFRRLNDEQLQYMVDVASENTLAAGQYLCRIYEKLDHFFLISKGEMEVLFETRKIQVDYNTPGHPPHLRKEFVKITQLGPGDICGWSGLVPPHISTSSVRALTSSTIITFNSIELLQIFERDCKFGFYMFQVAAQAIGKRLKAIYQIPVP